jgi:hypothetical protein
MFEFRGKKCEVTEVALNLPDCDDDGNPVEHPQHFAVQWEISNFGFGMFYFYVKDGKVHCDNETMSKDTIKEVLCKMVDDCVLDDPPRKKKPDDSDHSG